MPTDSDPSEFSPFRIAANGIDIAPRARVAGEPAKNHSQCERDPYERRLAENVGLRHGAVLVRENGRGNLTAASINDNAAPIDGKRSERRDDRRNAQARSQYALPAPSAVPTAIPMTNTNAKEESGCSESQTAETKALHATIAPTERSICRPTMRSAAPEPQCRRACRTERPVRDSTPAGIVARAM